MRVEMHQRERAAEPRRQRAQQRQGDAMLAAQRQQMLDARRLLLDALQAGRDVAERDGEIADVGKVERCRLDPELRMVAVGQHAAGAADRLRPVARAGAVGRADVQRNAGDDIVGVAIGAGDGQEVRRCGEGGGVGHAR